MGGWGKTFCENRAFSCIFMHRVERAGEATAPKRRRGGEVVGGAGGGIIDRGGRAHSGPLLEQAGCADGTLRAQQTRKRWAFAREMRVIFLFFELGGVRAQVVSGRTQRAQTGWSSLPTADRIT